MLLEYLMCQVIPPEILQIQLTVMHTETDTAPVLRHNCSIEWLRVQGILKIIKLHSPKL